jgi:hypothetical protein
MTATAGTLAQNLNHARNKKMEFRYIDHSGVALDNYGHEVRDESGAIIVVPPEDRGFYDIAYRPHEQVKED